MDEIWKPIKGYEGIYDISSLGKVRSYRNNRHGLKSTSHVISGGRGSHGYIAIGLVKNKNDRVVRTIHSLVAEMYIENPNNYRCINHKNGVKVDNRIENLEWCTHKQNMEHAVKFGLNSRGENHPYALLKESDISKIKELKKSHTYTELSVIFNITPQGLCDIVKGRNWKHVK